MTIDMLWSELAIATLREDNHPLLVRAGYMRGREYLFLGQRTLGKIAALLRGGLHWNTAAWPTSPRASDFVAESESGDEVLVRGTNYAALAAKAVGVAQPPAVPDPEGDLKPEEFHTPGVKTIAQIAEFTGLPATSQMKSLVMVRDGEPLLVLLRGDHQLSPAKLPGARQAERGRDPQLVRSRSRLSRPRRRLQRQNHRRRSAARPAQHDRRREPN